MAETQVALETSKSTGFLARLVDKAERSLLEVRPNGAAPVRPAGRHPETDRPARIYSYD
jgi:hypothetical protein